MMDYRDIIIRPIITEKTMKMMEEDNKVTFEVKKGANKVLVRQAVEALFKVKVVQVNVMNTKPKAKRVGRYEGQTKAVRKAIVKIEKGQSIDLFGSAE